MTEGSRHKMKAWFMATVMFVGLSVFADDIVTFDSKTYRNVKVTTSDPISITVSHSSGVARILFQEMSAELQKKYGYDAAKAASYLDVLKAKHATEASKQSTDYATPHDEATGTTNQVKSHSIDSDKELSKIVVTFEWQNGWNEGRKKLVVTIQNNSQYAFEGAISVAGKTPRDETVDQDTILFEDGLSPDGSRRFALLWFKNPEAISRLSYSIKGSFHAASVAKPSLAYEEIARVQGINFTTFFIYTSAFDEVSLRKIGEYYKERLKSHGGFKLLFFNDRTKTATSFPMSDVELSAWFGSYEFIQVTDETEFIVNGKHIK